MDPFGGLESGDCLTEEVFPFEVNCVEKIGLRLFLIPSIVQMRPFPVVAVGTFTIAHLTAIQRVTRIDLDGAPRLLKRIPVNLLIVNKLLYRL